jgi:hypothetical protein
MHAEKLLHKWLGNVLPNMHKNRLEALSAVVAGALRGGRLTVTGLGRSILSKAKEKHNIKRSDRLLSNAHLQAESMSVYAQVARRIIAKNSQPLILIDWSDIDGRRKFFLLRAAMPVKGRSPTIYEEVHDWSTKEKRSTHNQFLENLKSILPQDCKPVIVTDAGFRVPWLKKVEALGWNYVGRIRNRTMVSTSQESGWKHAKLLYPLATCKPKRMRETFLTRSNTLHCTLIAFRAKRKGRVRLGKMGKKKRNRTSLVNSTRAKEPWLLATSIDCDPQRIVEIYSKRMQIEESFRDLKCSRQGLSLYFNNTYKLERLKVLILIGSLAATFAYLLGRAATTLKLHRQFQANTETRYTVLSAVFIGLQLFRNRLNRISMESLFKEQISILKSESYT